MAVVSCCQIGDRLTLQAHLKKIIDDTERRLNILFDSLNNDAVPKDALSKTNEIARGKSLSNRPKLARGECVHTRRWLTGISYWRQRPQLGTGTACGADDCCIGRCGILGGQSNSSPTCHFPLQGPRKRADTFSLV